MQGKPSQSDSTFVVKALRARPATEGEQGELLGYEFYMRHVVGEKKFDELLHTSIPTDEPLNRALHEACAREIFNARQEELGNSGCHVRGVLGGRVVLEPNKSAKRMFAQESISDHVEGQSKSGGYATSQDKNRDSDDDCMGSNRDDFYETPRAKLSPARLDQGEEPSQSSYASDLKDTNASGVYASKLQGAGLPSHINLTKKPGESHTDKLGLKTSAIGEGEQISGRY